MIKNINDFKSVFFIGIAGVGMSAIAQYLQGIGKDVAGSDRYFIEGEENDGTVWAWGKNNGGQLGNGNTFDSNIPLQITSLSNVLTIEGGYQHALALKNDETVWAWGYNALGELGIGNYNNNYLPIQIPSLFGITSIEAGGSSSMALKNDGSVWSWGYNMNGQLGNGNNIDTNLPIQVINLCQVKQSTVSINEITEQVSVTIFPNPSNGIFNLEMEQFVNLKMGSIDIFNVLGEQIFQSNIQNQTSNIQINLSAQPKGIYFVNIKVGQELISKKIVIE